MGSPPRHVAVVGTTASGKSALALAVARARPDLELVSVDSMQVYRGMDIGTAKPTPAERAEVCHHLLDLADPAEDFTVARFQAEARAALADIEQRGKRAVFVGGTGLYLRAVVDDLDIPGRWPELRAQLEAEAAASGPGPLHERLAGLDPVAADRMEPGNARRIVRALEVTVGSGRRFSSYGPGLGTHADSAVTMVGIAMPPTVIAGRIARRYDDQLAGGFLGEVRALAARPAGMSRTARQALGYKELLAHLVGELDLDAAVELAVSRTRRFARRQRSWFRRDPRIRWLHADDDPADLLNPLLEIIDAPAD
jgi:tRNA dimethylallyltransferase